MKNPTSWKVDPNDPRAPSVAVWNAMSADERAAVAAALPSTWDAGPPEGTRHAEPVDMSKDVLSSYFRRQRRHVFIARDLGVYYPEEPRFAPDLLAVLDVAEGHRDRWLVAQEGRGLDFVLEVHLRGSKEKDFVVNVARYARLGIPEYFVYEPAPNRLTGFRLEAETDCVYTRIVPQHGMYLSRVLGTNLDVLTGKLRFLLDRSPLPTSWELGDQLERAVDGLNARVDELVARAEQESARAEQELARAEQESARADALAQQVEALKRRLAELEGEL